MAGNPAQLSDFEKIYLLTEIIKSNHPTPALLLNVIVHNGMQPNWNDIPLPAGRTLRVCKTAYDELTPAAAHTRPSTVVGTLAPSPISNTLPHAKRPYVSTFEGQFPQGRELRPKPNPSTQSPFEQASAFEAAQGDQPPRKKRGRPPKTAAPPRPEERTNVVATGSASRQITELESETPIFAISPDAVRGAVASPAPTSAPPSLLNISPRIASVSPGQLASPRVQSPATIRSQMLPPASSRMSINTMLDPTAAPNMAPTGSSSSNKRRRRTGSFHSQPDPSSPAMPTQTSQRPHYDTSDSPPETPDSFPRATSREETVTRPPTMSLPPTSDPVSQPSYPHT